MSEESDRRKTRRRKKSKPTMKPRGSIGIGPDPAAGDDPIVQVQLVPCWKASLEAYPVHERTALHFSCKDEAKKAISLFWTDELCGCPHTFTPEGVIIVPADAVPHLRRATLKFSECQVES